MKKKRWWLIGGGVLLLIGVVWRLSVARQPAVEYTTASVTRGVLSQTVSETGSVKPLEELSLNFLNTGKIAEIAVKVGDIVVKDQLLAQLDLSDLLIKQKETAAQLAVAQAQLDKLLAGASAEELAVVQAQVQSAQTAYDSALAELNNTKNSTAVAISQAEKTYQDLLVDGGLTTYEQSVNQAMANLSNAKKTYSQAIANQSDNLIISMTGKISSAAAALDAVDRIINDDSLSGGLGAKNSAYLTKTKADYTGARQQIAVAKNKLTALVGNEAGAAKEAYVSVNSAVNQTFSALNNCFAVLENSIVNNNLSQTALDSFKTSISGQITAISAALTSLQAAKQSLDDALLAYDVNVDSAENALSQAQAALTDAQLRAENNLVSSRLSRDQQLTAAEAKVGSALKSLKLAEAQLQKTSARARNEDIALSRSQVEQAKAGLQLIDNQINNSKILAPLDSVVAEVNYEVGEQALVGQPVLKLIAKDGFEIEIDVAETDIAKLKIGNPASITFDAFGDTVKLEGSLMFIEPAATVIQGVIYYKVKIDFLGGDFAIRPGMTATAEIIANRLDDVLQAPIRAVQERADGKPYVRVLRGSAVEERDVELGLSGDDGLVEIIKGLDEGEQVITFTKTNGKNSKN